MCNHFCHWCLSYSNFNYNFKPVSVSHVLYVWVCYNFCHCAFPTLNLISNSKPVPLSHVLYVWMCLKILCVISRSPRSDTQIAVFARRLLVIADRDDIGVSWCRRVDFHAQSREVIMQHRPISWHMWMMYERRAWIIYEWMSCMLDDIYCTTCTLEKLFFSTCHSLDVLYA
jgi:hypothetical protein